MGILSLSNDDCRSTPSLGDYLSFTSKTSIVAEYEFIHLSPFPAEVKKLIKNLGWEKFIDLRSRGSTSYCPHVVRKFYHNLELSGPCDSHLVSIFLGYRVCFQPHQFAEILDLPAAGHPIDSRSDLGRLYDFEFEVELEKLTKGRIQASFLPDPLRFLHWMIVNCFMPRYRGHSIIRKLDLFILVQAQRGVPVNLASLMCLNMVEAAPRGENWYTAFPYATFLTTFLERVGMDMGVYAKEDQCAYLPVYRIVELTNTFIDLRHTEHEETPEASSSKRPRLT
ncbi:unnamed protein product [Linum trigynum]|uniref:Putative plant transposon protein domain-containing protein n=1 Tax=Linum trigynum TaxID=586398 RepID=A0AAV2GC77_9ROSI